MKRLLIAVTLALSATAARAACPEPKLLDSILKANVTDDGYVDYDGIRAKKGGDIGAYTGSIELANLSTCSGAQKLAFWIDAYNANTIKLILERPKLKSISQDFKLFAEPVRVAGQSLTLNDIEHRVIRSDPKKGGPIKGVSLAKLDPRVHFALVCGAIDCPKLANFAYTGENLETALQAAAVNFANAPKHLRIENGKLVLSEIFKWYEDDFAKLGGVATYLITLTDSSKRSDAEAVDEKLKTDYPKRVAYKYDWTLNSIKNKK